MRHCQINSDVVVSRGRQQRLLPRHANSRLYANNTIRNKLNIKPCSFGYSRYESVNRVGLGVCCSVPPYKTTVPDAAEPADTKTQDRESGRRIVYAVDGTVHSEEGLRWFTRNITKKGDKVYLAHVLCDPRTPSTAVGSSTAATQWSPARDEQVFAKEFRSRAEREATEMIESRYVPSLEMNGIEYEIDLLPLKVHKSAGGIGETLVNGSLNMGADLLVIASHGAGVRTDYGSVARWCN